VVWIRIHSFECLEGGGRHGSSETHVGGADRGWVGLDERRGTTGQVVLDTGIMNIDKTARQSSVDKSYRDTTDVATENNQSKR